MLHLLFHPAYPRAHLPEDLLVPTLRYERRHAKVKAESRRYEHSVRKLDPKKGLARSADACFAFNRKPQPNTATLTRCSVGRSMLRMWGQLTQNSTHRTRSSTCGGGGGKEKDCVSHCHHYIDATHYARSPTNYSDPTIILRMFYVSIRSISYNLGVGILRRSRARCNPTIIFICIILIQIVASSTEKMAHFWDR
jgi:hypothetical protein